MKTLKIKPIHTSEEEMSTLFKGNQKTLSTTVDIVEQDREIISKNFKDRMGIVVGDDGIVRVPTMTLRFGLGKKLRELGVKSTIQSF